MWTRVVDWMLCSKWPRRIVLAPLALHPVFAARFLWHWRPGLVTALAFWGVALAWIAALALDRGGMAWVALAGGICNAAVVLGNRGRMPVVGKEEPGLRSVWIRANRRHRWLFLADREAWLGFSVGDVLIGSALVLRLCLCFLGW